MREIIYEIFIDRFNNHQKKLKPKDDKPVFCGGTLKGIIQKLDYIKQLGATAIWITPFNKTTKYHGYHITDFFDVDEHFGTNEDLPLLCKEAHKKGIKVYMDFVANHTSNKHPFFIQAKNHPESKYRKYYHFKKYPDVYETFMGVQELPKLNTNNKEVRNYLIQSALHWMNEGIDGFRLDHAIGPSISFWKEFRKEIKKKNPEAPIFGEITTLGINWNERKRLGFNFKEVLLLCKGLGMRIEHKILHQYIGIFDGVQDYETHSILMEFAKNGNYDEAKKKLNKHLSCFPKTFKLYLFLDNHDTNRYLYETGQNKERLLQALTLIAETNQPIIIYYGTETGMTQQKNKHDHKQHGDLEARKNMKWNNKELTKKASRILKNK